MYSRCLLCRAPFPELGILRHLPRGDLVAYDMDRGRLWVVCRQCRRWSLVPLESRWETLEELERIVAGVSGAGLEARLLAKTDHVALFREGSMEIVRVGSAGLTEEASWRYGNLPGLPRRRRGLRRRRRATVVWKGARSCSACGYVFQELPYTDRKILIVRPEEEEEQPPSLIRRCPWCRDADEGGLHLRGLEADLTLARVMAFEQDAPASLRKVDAAVRVVEREGPAALVRLLTRHGRPIGDLPPVGLLALEIYATEAREKALLSMEVAALEARWRREEELASLIDGNLTPVPLLEELVRRFRREG